MQGRVYPVVVCYNGGMDIGYALVTGASGGIGAEFARQLAGRGWGLVLVARSGDALEALAVELRAACGVDVRVVVADLSAAGAAVALMRELDGVRLDLLINNAGFGAFGLFGEIDRERQREMVMLNIGALVELAHLCLGPMVERGAGAVVNIASVAAFQPIPYMTVYAATKAFVLDFSRGLHAEYKAKGVHVMAVCPGATRTAFFERAGGASFAAQARMQTVEQVVAEGLRGLDRKKAVVVCGWLNRATTMVGGLVPAGPKTAVLAKVMRKLPKSS